MDQDRQDLERIESPEEILEPSFAPQDQRAEETPKRWRFSFTREEHWTLYKLAKKPRNVATQIFAWIGCVMWLLIFLMDLLEHEMSFSFGVVICLFTLVALFSYLRRRNWKEVEKTLDRSEDEVALVEDTLVYTTYRDGALRSQFVLRRDEIRDLRASEEFYVFTARGILFTVKRAAIGDPGALATFLPQKYRWVRAKTPTRRQSAPQATTQTDAPETVTPPTRGVRVTLIVFSWVLFAASVFSLWVGGVAAAILSNFNHLELVNLWTMLLCLPVPVAAIVIGIVMRRKRIGGLHAIIMGAIISSFLLVFGTVFPIAFGSQYNTDPSTVDRYEELLSLELPMGDVVNEEQGMTGMEGVTHLYIENRESSSHFLEQLKSDERFMTEVPNALQGIYRNEPDGGDFFLIYNADTGEYNQNPSESGTYRFISVRYYEREHKLSIYEYTLAYTAG